MITRPHDAGRRPRRLAVLEEVKSFLSDFPNGLLLNVLPPEHHTRMHIPGSRQACVFETAFSEHMEKLAPDPETPIMVYGAGASLDAAVATAKLLGLGYRNVRMWPGGLNTWRMAGLPLEGEDPCAPLEKNPAPPEGEYELQPLEGDIRWTGRNAHSSHYGHLFLKSGYLRMERGRNGPEGEGEIIADMGSIADEDLAGSPWQRVLLAHLASEDFFHSALYPEARLRISRLYPLPDTLRRESSGVPDHLIRGEAVIRGRSERVDIPAILRRDGDGLLLTLRADLDRTRWGVLYGSSKFFRCLGMHRVDDIISLEARLAFRRVN